MIRWKIEKFIVGDYVKLTNLPQGYERLEGTVGIITDINRELYTVYNSDSMIFEVEKQYLTHLLYKLEEENEQMAKLTGYYAVAVIEEGTGYCKKDYYYAVFDDGNTYKAGDQVLVSGCNKDVLTIKEILTVPEAKEKGRKDITAEIICRVDTSAYDQRVENRKKAEKLKKDMDAVIKQMDVTKKYEMYATENPELAALLDQYKELTK
jgi:hypothetical protein